VVGVAAAASGGALAMNSRRKPSNNRLIMAFETNKEAVEWKSAIETQIRILTESKRPMLPDSVDAKTISAILNLSTSGKHSGGLLLFALLSYMHGQRV
jgi:formylmethanofuran dehydrogenase subunit B